MSEEIRRSVQRAAAVLRQFGAREVYLFGSSTGVASRTPSDIDIAVSGIPPRLFFRAMSKAGDALDRPLDLVDLDEDTPFTRFLREKGDLAVVE